MIIKQGQIIVKLKTEMKKMNEVYRYVSFRGEVKGIYDPRTRVLKIWGINGHSKEYADVYSHLIAIQIFDEESEKDIFSKTLL